MRNSTLIFLLVHSDTLYTQWRDIEQGEVGLFFVFLYSIKGEVSLLFVFRFSTFEFGPNIAF